MTGNSVRVGSGTAPAQVNRQAVSEVMHSLGRAAQRRPDDDPVQDLPLWEMAGAMEDCTTLPTATAGTSLPTATTGTSLPTTAARTSLPTATAPGLCDLDTRNEARLRMSGAAKAEWNGPGRARAHPQSSFSPRSALGLKRA
jgi:hypothetical protein